MRIFDFFTKRKQKHLVLPLLFPAVTIVDVGGSLFFAVVF